MLDELRIHLEKFGRLRNFNYTTKEITFVITLKEYNMFRNHVLDKDTQWTLNTYLQDNSTITSTPTLKDVKDKFSNKKLLGKWSSYSDLNDLPIVPDDRSQDGSEQEFKEDEDNLGDKFNKKLDELFEKYVKKFLDVYILEDNKEVIRDFESITAESSLKNAYSIAYCKGDKRIMDSSIDTKLYIITELMHLCIGIPEGYEDKNEAGAANELGWFKGRYEIDLSENIMLNTEIKKVKEELQEVKERLAQKPDDFSMLTWSEDLPGKTGNFTVITDEGLYSGQVTNGELTGQGIYRYKNGDVYEGFLEGGEPKGLGTMTYFGNVEPKVVTGNWTSKDTYTPFKR